MEKQTIVAIKPGGKYLGVAFFKGIELIDWRIKRVKVKCMKPAQAVKKAEMIISRFIDDYKPGIIALEEACFKENRKGSISGNIISKVTGLGKKRGLKMCFFNPAEVKEFICQGKKASKMEVAKRIATQFYPWLYWRYSADSNKHWYEKKYHTFLFDAVALGIYCYYQGGKVVKPGKIGI